MTDDTPDGTNNSDTEHEMIERQGGRGRLTCYVEGIGYADVPYSRFNNCPACGRSIDTGIEQAD